MEPDPGATLWICYCRCVECGHEWMEIASREPKDPYRRRKTTLRGLNCLVVFCVACGIDAQDVKASREFASQASLTTVEWVTHGP